MSARFLTKSRFKVGHDCPTKLYFLDDKKYGNAKEENAFLEALAEGGFQVGELAKLYFEGGFDIDTLDRSEAIARTNELLKRPNVIIYEAAFQCGQLFIRADILVKNGNDIDLIEVKAKSGGGDLEPGHFHRFNADRCTTNNAFNAARLCHG